MNSAQLVQNSDPHDVKDKILLQLPVGTVKNTSQLAEALNLPLFYVVTLVEELLKDGMVQGQEITSIEPVKEYIIAAEPKGLTKIQFQGGYKAELEKARLEKKEVKTRTFLNGANAVVIIILTVVSIWVSNKSDRLEAKIEKLEDERDSLKTIISTPFSISATHKPEIDFIQNNTNAVKNQPNKKNQKNNQKEGKNKGK